MFGEILKKVLLSESVSISDIDSAIDNHRRVIINYHSDGKDVATGARIIEVYAYGYTKAGNPVIRAFQPYGDTTSRVPSWKFFRLDRIRYWEEQPQTFSHPASFYYRNIGEFNPDGDKTMSQVLKIAKFGGEEDELTTNPKSTNPKMKTDMVYTPQGEKDTMSNMERLRQQVDNPIYLSDIKAKNGFKDYSKEVPKTTGPKTKEDMKGNNDDVYKTDSERQMDSLRQQLKNPKKIDLSQFDRKGKTNDKEIEDLRNKLGDTNDRITIKDLNDRLSKTVDNNNTEKTDNVYKTDTERQMDSLRQQLKNPKKIDLSRIPRR